MKPPGFSSSSRAHRPQLLPPHGPVPPKPAELNPQQVAAQRRYHDQLGVSHLLPGGKWLAGHATRQDGFLAEQTHIPARALAHYQLGLTNAKTRAAQEARRAQVFWQNAAQPTQPTALISQGEYHSPTEIQARQQQQALAASYAKYVQNVELISGEYTPLTLHDPVIRSIAEGGLMTMSGIGAARLVAATPLGLRWADLGLEYGTGVRASYTAWRAAPQVFWQGATYRAVFDFTGQYVGAKVFGGDTLFSTGWIESLGEVNFLQSFTAGANLNSYTASIGTAAFSLSVNHGFQSVFYASNNSRSITQAKFYAQAATGLLLTKAGAEFEAKMTKNSFLSWQLYKGAMRIGVPRVAYSFLGAGVRFGQSYGVPLTNSIIGSLGTAGTGYAADKLFTPASEPAVPPHPNSPVFLP